MLVSVMSYDIVMLQDVPASGVSKVSSVMMRHSHQPTDNRDKIKQWIREQGSVEVVVVVECTD